MKPNLNRFGMAEYMGLSINQRINFKSYWITGERNSFVIRVLSEVAYSWNSYYKNSPFPIAW